MSNELAPLISALIAFGITLLIGPKTIQYLRRLKFGQQIRSDGPQTHYKKAGTPSMGGIIILLGLTIGVVLVRQVSDHVALALFATLGFGVIGFVDDLIKIVAKRPLGLRAREKLVGQIGISLLVALYAYKC